MLRLADSVNSKKEASDSPLAAADAVSVDELAAQIRPAWETGESDTVSAPAPRPIERITAQARTDEELTVKPAMRPELEESGERKVTDDNGNEDLTMRVAAPQDYEERTEVDRAPPREIFLSDPQEVALSPMRPRAITVPTGFDPKAEGAVEAERAQLHVGASSGRAETAAGASSQVRRPGSVPEEDELVVPKNKRPIRVVFAVMGGLVVLIGLGVIVKAAIGGAPSTTSSTPGFAARATNEPARAEGPAADVDTTSKPKAKLDIPPPPAEESMRAEPPPVARSASLPSSLPIASARIAAPFRPPTAAPARPAAGARPTPPPKPGKGGIVRDTPF